MGWERKFISPQSQKVAIWKNDEEKISGILFDMDGVLVDSEPHHYDAETIIFQEFKIDIPPKLRHSFTGMSNHSMWETVAINAGLSEPAQSLQERADEIRVNYFMGLKNLQPIDGIPELLDLLESKKFPLPSPPHRQGS